MSYVVVITFPDRIGIEVRGPYRAFKQANADAKAFDAISGQSASVEPVVPVAGHKRLPVHLATFQAVIGPHGK